MIAEFLTICPSNNSRQNLNKRWLFRYAQHEVIWRAN